MNSFTRIGLRSRFLLVLMIGLILPTLSVWGQNATITGKVVDPKGEPLVGVSVLEQGTTNGTVTDMNGRYSIVVQKDSSPLRFSYMGFDNQEIVPGKRRVIDVTLTENSVVIDDVVVIAYGTKKRRDMIGSVSKIKSDEMSLMQGGRFENSLQGLASGVQVVNDGMPGSTPQIKIRGIGSIASGSDPLWVVDGIVGGGSTMVNSNDIESIEVLKDAAATAIYGSRGANGVIIVTTKKGKKGGLKFDVHYEGGITPITNSDLGLASTKTYFNIMDEARANVGLNPLDPQKDIIEPYYSNWTSPITREEAMNTDMDWVDLVTRMGHFHDINVALNQGGENSTTYASVNYRSDESSLKGLSMNAVSARLNSEFKKGIVTLGTQSFLKFDRKKSTNKWAVVSDKFPWRKVYDPEDPTGYWNPQMADGHPTATLDNDYQLSTGENFSFRTTLYMDVNLKWIKGLSVRADASYGYGLAQSDYWLSGLITNTGNVDGNQGNKSKKTTKSQQYHAFAKYNREWTDHGLDIVTGIEANRSYTDNAVVAGKNLSGEFQEPKIIGTMLGNNSAYIGGESYTFSFFNRIDYKFKQRYLLGASFVREGSSKFVKENRFGDFYSVSGGWIISDEAFMRNAGFISLLKLRGSYGETGNQNIPSEVTKNSYSIKSKQ
ncbi:SusC/RagA family TonB-linked outer membrane protein [Bacteroides caccae]|nr:SusC/RagA family TonB-linked outer membrane protein [Bacteroides caccae]MDC7127782.1 SusC/RagA family TonB-linked outer membrane protein [Bacteroides caccae]